MEERIAAAPTPRTAAEYRAAIDELLAGIRRMNEPMDRPRTELVTGDGETMEERIVSSPAPKTAAEYRAAVEDLLGRLQRMNEQSEQTWTEIEQAKADSTAIRAETDKTIARIDARLAEIEALL